MNAPSGTRASLFIADYIAIDASGKINAIGLGFSVSGLLPTGNTPPHYVAAIIDLPASLAGEQIPVLVELRDETTKMLVTVKDQAGSENALRIQHLAPVHKTQVPGAILAPDLPCRVQMVWAFPAGLPLLPGHRYAWKLEVAGTRFKAWTAQFDIPAPPPALIVGGPAGPADIPDVDRIVSEQDDEPDDDDRAIG